MTGRFRGPRTLPYDLRFECHYQTAEVEQPRWTKDVIVVSRPVSMGTRASLPPEVFVVVDGVKSPVALRLILDRSFCTGEGLDQVNLIVDAHEPPAVWDRCGIELIELRILSMEVKLTKSAHINP